MVVTDRPFIPPGQTAPGSTTQQQSTSQKEGKKATQPVEAAGALPGSQQMEVPGDVPATRPVEAPGAGTENLPTDQDASLPFTADRNLTGGRSDLQSPVPAKKRSVTSGPAVSVEEPASEAGNVSDRSSSIADEGEVSDLESTGLEQEELLEGDQELSAEQSYRETLRGVRSFLAWNDIPEFDPASSGQDDHPFSGNRSSQTGKVSVKVPVDEWLCRKFEKLNITLQEGYPTHNSETAGLSKDQFIKPPKNPQVVWYAPVTRKTFPGRKCTHGQVNQHDWTVVFLE